MWTELVVKNNRKARTVATGEREVRPETQAWMIKIGSTIREYRERKPWSQEALATTAELSRKTVSDLENASRSYGIDSLIDTMLALDVDPWTFFGGSAHRRPKRKVEHEILYDYLDRILVRAEEREELLTAVTAFLSVLSVVE